MNTATILKRLRELCPHAEPLSITAHKSGNSGHVSGTVQGKMRVSYWERGPYLLTRTEEDVAQELAREFKA